MMVLNANFFSLRFVASLFFIFFGFIIGAKAIEIQNIQSDRGLHAWLVEDKSVPIISINFSFQGGSSQDPKNKEGLVKLMSGLFDEGAGNIRSNAFQARLDDLGAELAFSASRDRIVGSMRVLSENSQAAFQLLAMALQEPRFDEDAINRIREQMITGIKASEKDPQTIARTRLNSLIYGKHPYSRQMEGTIKSLNSITRDDLVTAHKAMFARNNLHIGIVGPISVEDSKKLIDTLFAPLPKVANLTKIDDVTLRLGGTANVNYDQPQTTLTLVYPSLARDDEDFFAAYLMNYILGGPGLTSRLFSEVREKRGLAYSVGSYLANYDHSAALLISTGTKSSEAQKTLATIREEVKKITTNGISQQELEDAKSYVIGSYAVQTMGSSAEIAATLVGLQDQNLPIDYIQKRAELINAVSLEQVQKIAKKLLSTEPALLFVGPAKA